MENYYFRGDIKIPGKKDLKKDFGKLGMFLIEKANTEIKKKNQQMLFEKAEIKRKNGEKLIEKSKNIKNNFLFKIFQELNEILSSTILNNKKILLEQENNLINEFIKELKAKLEKGVKHNQSKYYNFILNLIKQIFSDNKKSLKNSIIHFSKNDFMHFSQNKAELDKIIDKNTKIEQAEDIILGGFKITQDKGQIIFNFDISNIIKENRSLIDIYFSKLFSDSNVKILQQEFENFINKKKKEIKNYLIKYDEI
ncbi:MAG: hypothetical protein JXA99_10905 [Candidatus Lokiarchaeota archaeon]|nr:hypothetical protein [Candidatus Lokiarchaeota archaeon]